MESNHHCSEASIYIYNQCKKRDCYWLQNRETDEVLSATKEETVSVTASGMKGWLTTVSFAQGADWVESKTGLSRQV